MSDKVGERRSCLGCPSYLSRKEAAEFLHADPGTAICARYGYVLEKKGMEEGHRKRVVKAMAEKCEEYGKPRPERPIPSKMNFTVVMPNPDAMTYSQTHYDKTVGSCMDCHWFVRSEVIQPYFGWRGGVCQAKGKLVGEGRSTLEAEDCGLKRGRYSYGESIKAEELIPVIHLHDSFAPKLDPLAAFKERQDSFVDPREFTSDIEVTEEEREAGIRAWREVEDPKSGNVVLMPVYDFNYFTPEQQALIPVTGDEGKPELYVDYENAAYRIMICWRELDETPMAWGEPGVGKTELYRHLAWLMCLPFHRISITGSTEVDDLIGKIEFSKDKGTYYRPGRLVTAWESPGVICIDEPNTGQPDVWQLLRPLTDNIKQLVLDQADGRRVDRHSEAYLGMAANPSWDARNIGAEPLADADVSRIMHLEIGMPPEDVERRIITDRCNRDGFEISDEQLDLVMRVGADIRALSLASSFPGTWGTRNSIKWARLLRYLAPEDAIMMAVGNFLDPEQRQQITDVLHQTNDE